MLLKQISLSLFLCIILSYSYAQQTYNFKFDYDFAVNRCENLVETDSFYYAFGYANDIVPPFGSGVYVACHDKKTGALIRKAIYKRPNENLYLAGRTKAYLIGDEIQFAINGIDIYKLSYNVKSNSFRLIDNVSLAMPEISGYYIHEMLLRGDTTIYVATRCCDSNNVVMIIYSSGSYQKVYSIEPPSGHYIFGGRLVFLDNGKKYLFGGLDLLNSISKHKLNILELDNNFKIKRQYLSDFNELNFRPHDVIIENDSTAMVLVQYLGSDKILNDLAFPHRLYKFDLKNFKVIWKRSRELPMTAYTAYPGQLVKGHRSGEYLYTTDCNGADATAEHYYAVGRVVKVKSDGTIIWHRDYSHFSTENYDINNFACMMPTSDGNYLVGGEAWRMIARSWLLKIDEDGYILPIDTISSLDKIDIPNIEVFPNPTHDIITINQNDITDVTYTIYDLNGQVVQSRIISGSYQSAIWDISTLSSGQYVLTISHGGKIIKSQTLVKM